MSKEDTPPFDLGCTLSVLLLRIWLSVRALQTGIEKFAGSRAASSVVNIDGQPNDYGLTESSSEKVYALSNYSGVPDALYDKFKAEPLIPEFALKIYDAALGPALLILGITLLIGLGTRISLFAMGLMYTSLTLGLILIKQDAGVAWLGIHIIMVAMALVLAKHNRLAILKNW